MIMKNVLAAVDSGDLVQIKTLLRELDHQGIHTAEMREAELLLARAFQLAIAGVNEPPELEPVISSLVPEGGENPERLSRQQNGRAVALLTHKDLLRKNGSHWTLTTWTLSDAIGGSLCPGERFVDFPASSPATAFLVQEDLVVTLRHNLASATYSDHAALRVIFDFELQVKGEPESCKLDFLASEVYAVTTSYSLVDDSPNAFVALRLSRPVSDRRPVTCNFGVPIGPGKRIYMIGHPCGLPKIDNFNAAVMDVSSADTFTASLDAFAGNSGSPIFNSDTNHVEGILAEGGTDFLTREDGNGGPCYVTNVYKPTLYPYVAKRIQTLQRLVGP